MSCAGGGRRGGRDGKDGADTSPACSGGTRSVPSISGHGRRLGGSRRPPGEDAEDAEPRRVRTLVTRLDRLRGLVDPAPPTAQAGGTGTIRGLAQSIVKGRDDVTARELQEAGMSRAYITILAARGVIRRVRHGVYEEAAK